MEQVRPSRAKGDPHHSCEEQWYRSEEDDEDGVAQNLTRRAMASWHLVEAKHIYT
jgi:hypothetical protein